MADFTEAERAYIAFFEQQIVRLPDSYCSVKNIRIADRQTLLETFFYYMHSSYYPNSIYINPGTALFTPGGNQIFFNVNSSQPLFNFREKSQEELNALSSSLIEKIMRYLPTFPTQIPRDISFLQYPKNVKRTTRFLRHLEINRSLLLQGPPYANEHTIDYEKGALWVQAQRTPQRQRLAQILLDNIIYIPHTRILHALQHCVQKVKKQLQAENRLGNPIILITGRVYKSNYYIALLFAHFWLQAGMRIDCVYEKYFPESLQSSGTILDVDDMAYSGNQTRMDIGVTAKDLFNMCRAYMMSQLKDNNDFKQTYMLIPRIAIESLLNSTGFRYFMIRAFMSEAGFKEITKTTTVSLPMRIFSYKKIPYLPGVSEEDKRKLETLFNKSAATTVYLDHKVADYPSTFLLPITFGIIPERPIVGNIRQYKPNDPRGMINEIGGEGVDFLPFIRHCGPTEREMPVNRQNMMYDDVRDELRCPYAWYKMIDYDTGTYPKVPLPFGPTENNFLGGERSGPKRRTTRKHKQKRRRQTKKV